MCYNTTSYNNMPTNSCEPIGPFYLYLIDDGIYKHYEVYYYGIRGRNGDCWLTTEFSNNPNIEGPYFYRSTGRSPDRFCALTYVLSGEPNSSKDNYYVTRSNIDGSYYISSRNRNGHGYLKSTNGIYGPYYLICNDSINNNNNFISDCDCYKKPYCCCYFYTKCCFYN